jgi:homoserine O-acetyltransferase/O-succinyltransferase
MNIFKIKEPFFTESGEKINELQIVYHTYGQINPAKSNVIWICHALTADSEAARWWSGMVGKGKLYDPETYFIICANILGSCYGTTGPLDINPETDQPWFGTFPEITIRDMVMLHELLRKHLKINHIHTVVGGSIGGFQAMEWAICNPAIFSHLVLIACSAKSTPWIIAFNEAQRLAIQADSSFYENCPQGGLAGLKAARSIALLSYRNARTYNQTQAEDSDEITIHFKAASYQRYQGDKLANRFNAYSYYVLTKAIDSHNVARKRGSVQCALGKIIAKTMVIGINSDLLFPVEEQKLLTASISGAQYHEISSNFGHDGFLIEDKLLTETLINFYNH